jgi:hypothetical protein
MDYTPSTMKSPLVLLGCSVAFVQPASAKSAAEIEAVARSVIDNWFFAQATF